MAEQEPLISEREALEGLGVDSLVDLIISQGQRATEIERTMDLAAQVLEGYGTDIISELDKREKDAK